jgi:hypothetical protein
VRCGEVVAWGKGQTGGFVEKAVNLDMDDGTEFSRRNSNRN